MAESESALTDKKEANHPPEDLPRHVSSAHSSLLCELVEGLSEELGQALLSVVLFGSVARGMANVGSDIDILVVFDENSVKRKTVRDTFIAVRSGLSKAPPPFVSSVVLSYSEAKATPYVFLDIAQDGIVLLDPQHVFCRMRCKVLDRLKQLGAQRVYLEDGTWYWNLKPDAKLNEPIKI